MWPIPALEHELISISFSPDSVACSWIQKTTTGTAPLILRAYKRYLLTNLELENLTIFNPTVIKKHITSFLQEHNLSNAFIAISLQGPGLMEKFVTMPTSTPHHTDFGIATVSNVQWEYRYLYPSDHGQYVFYVYSFPRSLLLQYKLLAIAAQLNVIAITTKTMSLLDTYKNVFGTAFRRSQLAIDMMRHNNNIDKLISVDALRRIITIPAEIGVLAEKSSIASACGLFFSERMP